MIGKIILLGVLVVSVVFTWMSVASAISKKMAIGLSLIPIAFALALAAGVLLVFLGK